MYQKVLIGSNVVTTIPKGSTPQAFGGGNVRPSLR